ncbi:hypothetical protein DUNSADRAFT_18383, partial [Dunaliella salina]
MEPYQEVHELTGRLHACMDNLRHLSEHQSEGHHEDETGNEAPPQMQPDAHPALPNTARSHQYTSAPAQAPPQPQQQHHGQAGPQQRVPGKLVSKMQEAWEEYYVKGSPALRARDAAAEHSTAAQPPALPTSHHPPPMSPTHSQRPLPARPCSWGHASAATASQQTVAAPVARSGWHDNGPHLPAPQPSTMIHEDKDHNASPGFSTQRHPSQRSVHSMGPSSAHSAGIESSGSSSSSSSGDQKERANAQPQPCMQNNKNSAEDGEHSVHKERPARAVSSNDGNEVSHFLHRRRDSLSHSNGVRSSNSGSASCRSRSHQCSRSNRSSSSSHTFPAPASRDPFDSPSAAWLGTRQDAAGKHA